MMTEVVALWRSMENGCDWQLVKLFWTPPGGEGGLHRYKAVEYIKGDISKWTLPLSYKITTEHVEQ